MDVMLDVIENKQNVYRGGDCMKKIFESLKDLAVKMINFEKEKTIPSTKEQQESYKQTKICYICKKICLYTNALVIKTIKSLGTIACVI